MRPPSSSSSRSHSLLSRLLRQFPHLSSARFAHDFLAQHSSSSPSSHGNHTFLSNFLIDIYGRFGCLADARAVFDLIPAPNLFSWNILLKVYGQNSSPHSAYHIFHVMPSRDVVSWTAMIMIFSRHGDCEKAITLFSEMSVERIIPNKVALICVLEACASLARLRLGQEINGIVLRLGFEADGVLGTALVVMYGKCGSIPEARRVFRGIIHPDAALWNAMISALVRNDEDKEALSLFWEMQCRGLNPDSASFISVLNVSSSLRIIFDMHAAIICVGLGEDIEVNNTLINLYGKHGSLTDALDVFSKMIHRTVVSWNAILTVFAERKHWIMALRIFDQMYEKHIVLDKVTFLGVLSACTSSASLEIGREVHSMLVERGYESDLTIGNKIITLYGACDFLKDARNVFDKSSKLDSVTWSSMIWTYCYSNHTEDALYLFYNMQLEMMEPNRAIFLCAIDACATLGAHDQGLLLHTYIVEMAFDQDLLVDNALLNFYSKSFSLNDARNVFETIVDPDNISWTTLMMGYSKYGYSRDVLELFCMMQNAGCRVDSASFTCILLACNHDGQVDATMHYFVSMVKDYLIPANRDQFLCVVDMLGRSGSLDAAENLINGLPPEHMNAAWQCLLAACRIHTDIERGTQATVECLNLDSNDPVPYILLSNLFVMEEYFQVQRSGPENY